MSTHLDGRDVRQRGQVLRVGDGRDELDGRHGGAGGAAVGAGHGGRGGAGGVDGGVVHGDHREGPGVPGVGVLGRHKTPALGRGDAAASRRRRRPKGRDLNPTGAKLTLTASTAPASTEGRATLILFFTWKGKGYFMWLGFLTDSTPSTKLFCIELCFLKENFPLPSKRAFAFAKIA